jgi:hypothetical protein
MQKTLTIIAVALTAITSACTVCDAQNDKLLIHRACYQVTYNALGTVTNIQVLSSSGNPDLDQMGMKIMSGSRIEGCPCRPEQRVNWVKFTKLPNGFDQAELDLS